MRLPIIALFVALVSTGAQAWDADDHEIFRLHDEVRSSEGQNATFYSFVGVSRKASTEDIGKAYRRRAPKLHPDKARQSFVADYKAKHSKGGKPSMPSNREIEAFYNKANERYLRLNLIQKILRSPRRERYDFFLDHGFPRWRGTGYYYERYRPGAGTVLVGLFLVFGGAAHYGALILGWKRQRQFAESYIKKARTMAWGNSMVIPGLDTASSVSYNSNGASNSPSFGGLNRKQKRQQEKENRRNPKKDTLVEESGDAVTPTLAGPVGQKKRVVAENGNELIVDSQGNVFLEETSEEGETRELLIDINEIRKPTFSDTALVRLPIWAWRRTTALINHQLTKSSALDTREDNAIPADSAKMKMGSTQNGETRKRRLKQNRNIKLSDN